MEIDGLMILKLNKNQRLRSLIAIFSMPCRSISITRVNEKEPHDDFSFLFIGSSFLLGLFCLLFFFSISRSICLFVFLFPFVFFLIFFRGKAETQRKKKKRQRCFRPVLSTRTSSTRTKKAKQKKIRKRMGNGALAPLHTAGAVVFLAGGGNRGLVCLRHPLRTFLRCNFKKKLKYNSNEINAKITRYSIRFRSTLIQSGRMKRNQLQTRIVCFRSRRNLINQS